MKLVLASGSPRRSELLKREGYTFLVQPSPVEELKGGMRPPYELAVENSRIKASDIARSLDSSYVVLGADTIVILEGEVLGKPVDLEEARSMLWKLSGKTHEVCTGVCLLANGKEKLFYELSQVSFKELSEDIIDDYHEKVEVLDKAGGYGAQSQTELIIREIKGEFENVMGLPVLRVKHELAKLGIKP